MNILKKYWKVLVVVICVPLVLIWGSFVYVRGGYKKPIFAINYNSNRVPNGERYDGILFSTFYCKDGVNKVKLRFTNYKCSDERIFTNGYYINDLGVKIDEDMYNNHLKNGDYYSSDEKEMDIDMIDEDTYSGMVKLIKRALDGSLSEGSFYFSGVSEDGYKLMQHTNSENEETYVDCYLGKWKDGDVISGEYVDGKCVIPSNIDSLLKNEKVELVDNLKNRLTCEYK